MNFSHLLPDPTTPLPQQSAIASNTNNQMSACQLQQQNAEESISNKQVLGAFVPQCQPGGAYKPVQCHALTGFCWCVDGNGSRVQGTEERFKMPNCEGMSIKKSLFKLVFFKLLNFNPFWAVNFGKAPFSCMYHEVLLCHLRDLLIKDVIFHVQ